MITKNKLYNGEVELMFENFRHRYTRDSVAIPSVTTILNIIAKPALVGWASRMCSESIGEAWEAGKKYDEIEIRTILDAGQKAHWQKKTDAGSIGTLLHNWVEDYINGKDPGMPVNEMLKESVEKFLGWVKEHEVEFLLSEQVCYSKKYNYVGTLDFICKIDGKLYLGDLKTSNAIYPTMLIQTAAYRHARVEEYPEEGYVGQLILRIGKDGSFEVVVVRDDKMYKEMFMAFIAALKLHEQMDFLGKYTGEKL